MSDGLYLLSAKPRQRSIHAVKFRIGSQTHREIVDIVETINGVSLHSSVLVVPRLHDLLRIHTVGKGEIGCDVDVIEEREGGINRYLMTHTIAPVLDKTALEEQILLGVDAVCECAGIAHAYLLVPTLLACHLLALEGIEAVELDSQVGQRNRKAAILYLLGKVEVATQRQTDIGEGLTVVDTARPDTLRIAFRIVHADEIIALVTACREVYASRETLCRVGFRVLSVSPGYLEAFRDREVRHILLASLGVLVAYVEISAVPISLFISGLC